MYHNERAGSVARERERAFFSLLFEFNNDEVDRREKPTGAEK